jgi:hypothetical protein
METMVVQLDPHRIYHATVEARPPHWMPAPPYHEVDPNG